MKDLSQPHQNQKQNNNQKTEMHINQNRPDKLGPIFALVGFLAYALPYVISSEIALFDMFFAIGLSMGFGGTLLTDSYKLRNISDDIKFSVSVFFICLGTTFLLDSIFDWAVKTNIYVKIYLLITILCFVVLLIRTLLSPRLRY